MGWIFIDNDEIPHDDILEGLYKLRIRESVKFKTVLEFLTRRFLRRLKTMVERCIEQDHEIRTFELETEIMKKRHGQESTDKTA